MAINALFLDASTDALVRRFSETRRQHRSPTDARRRDPGAGARGSARRRGARLVDAIELERELLARLREVSTVIDTSQLRPAQLRVWMRELVRADATA